MLAATRQWSSLVGNNVIEEFRRKDVNATSTISDRTMAENMEALFREPGSIRNAAPAATSQEMEAVEKRNTSLATTTRVKDGKQFSAFTPESEQVLTAELRLMGYLHENNMWGRVNDAWVTSLLPVGALVHIVPRKARVWVLKTNAAAALCWPAEEVAHRVWRKKLGIAVLERHTIFNVADEEVLTTRYWPPLRLQLEVIYAQ